ncbi:hypothetical protein FQZ97_1210030 [compost metagenome]
MVRALVLSLIESRLDRSFGALAVLGLDLHAIDDAVRAVQLPRMPRDLNLAPMQHIAERVGVFRRIAVAGVLGAVVIDTGLFDAMGDGRSRQVVHIDSCPPFTCQLA